MSTDLTPGTVVQWWDRYTGGRRLGTVASVRQSRRGAILRILQGDGSTNEPALYLSTRSSRGVLDWPADEVTRYVRRHWPDVPPGESCDECGEPNPDTNGHDTDCPTYDEQSREVLPEDDHPRCCDECGQKLDRAYKPHETTCGACLNVRDEPQEPTPAPPLPPLVFIEPRDLDSGDGSPLALF